MGGSWVWGVDMGACGALWISEMGICMHACAHVCVYVCVCLPFACACADKPENSLIVCVCLTIRSTSHVTAVGPVLCHPHRDEGKLPMSVFL